MNGYVVWTAKCDCGNVIETPSYTFKRGEQKTCGCGPTGRPRIPNGGAHLNALFNRFRRSASERGLSFSLSKEDIRRLVQQPCTYCGAPPKEKSLHSNLSGTFVYGSIDRIDSSKGYELGNVTPCCNTCNTAKSNMPVDDFLSWISRAYHHLNAES